jgi:hypothetical protein
MNDLEKLKENILNVCKDKFDIFYSEPVDERENYIVWKGEDFKEYLSLAEKLNIKMIYFFESIINNEEDSKYNGKIGQIEIGFLYNGIFHTFIEIADWLEEFEELKEEKTEKQILEKSEEELANEIIESIYKDYKEPLDVNENIIDNELIRIWEEKDLLQSYRTEPTIKMKLQKVSHIVHKHFSDIARKKEGEILPPLIDECVVWCKKQGLTKIIKSNLKVFLSDKNIDLTSIGKEELYFKVNNELKKKNKRENENTKLPSD